MEDVRIVARGSPQVSHCKDRVCAPDVFFHILMVNHSRPVSRAFFFCARCPSIACQAEPAKEMSRGRPAYPQISPVRQSCIPRLCTCGLGASGGS